MINPALILKHLIFLGVHKKPVKISFDVGLNIIYGASETGKSFILESIDYMFGGKELRPISESDGYSQILLGIDVIGGESFTVVRNMSGGNFTVYDGLHELISDELAPLGTNLLKTHRKGLSNTISAYLLNKINLSNKCIRKNVQGTTIAATIRNLIPLSIVDEQKIQKQISPIHTGQVINVTSEFSLFNLLLSGIDDSCVKPVRIIDQSQQLNESKVEIIQELIIELLEQFSEGEPNQKDLVEQLQKLDRTLNEYNIALDKNNEFFKSLSDKLVVHRMNYMEIKERSAEIGDLIARFNLLNDHYESDLERLEAIKEAGQLIEYYADGNCSVCGAEQQYHTANCDGDNLENVVIAVEAEQQKIKKLKKELVFSIESLMSEITYQNEQLKICNNEMIRIESEIKNLSPSSATLQLKLSDIMEIKVNLMNSLRVLDQINALKEKQNKLVPNEKTIDIEEISLTQQVDKTDEFAKKVEAILKAWDIPNVNDVIFDHQKNDLIISNNPRRNRGKGMRSITHSAFTVGLLEFCKENNLPHLGFIVLDSPLLAYREPDNDEDDLSNTDVNMKFYEYFLKWNDRQIIVIENIDPPERFKTMKLAQLFSKNSSGRYGFFPELNQQ